MERIAFPKESRQPPGCAKEFKCDRVAFKGSSFNIAPSQTISTVIDAGDNNEGIMMRWGLIPHWVNRPWRFDIAEGNGGALQRTLDSWKGNLINARVETADEKPSFKDAFKKRPCLIPVTGFYEWSKDKQPYYFHRDKSLFALAGIYESWRGAESEILSCTILTTEAQDAVAQVHHRMPIVISAEHYDLWLSNLDGRKELVDSLPKPELQLYPVSKMVNSPKNNSPDCIKPIK